MKDIMDEIESYTRKQLKELNSGQLKTIEALLLAGYKGEREKVLERILQDMEEPGVQISPLIESFTYTHEDGEKARYWRIKPELYRAIRREILK